MGEQRKGDRGYGGGGPSSVGTSGAMRARDVTKVRPADEEAAARRVVIRRNPPDAQPRTR